MNDKYLYKIAIKKKYFALCLGVFLASLLGFSIVQADNFSSPPKSIPMDLLGCEAQKLLNEKGKSIKLSKEKVVIEAKLQALQGEVTSEGLWLKSTALEDEKKCNGFTIKAMHIGRNAVSPLSDFGEVSTKEDFVSWIRPGLIEEYRVTGDGLRQDFVVTDRPDGSGDLQVILEAFGAEAITSDYGAKLIVDATGRELAYHRLHVTDATGRELSASLEVADSSRLLVKVDDVGANYPVRIDPTFTDVDWISLNTMGFSGVEGVISCMKFDKRGNLYVGGWFGLIGKVRANGIAKWDGNSWWSIGDFPAGTEIMELEIDVVKEKLYCIDKHRYNVSEVDLVGGFISDLGSVLTNSNFMYYNLNSILLDDDGNLYLCGNFTTVKTRNIYNAGNITPGKVTVANRIAKWNGIEWSALGEGFNDRVSAMAFDNNGNLYVGGEFTTAGGMAANRIAKWNGSAWSALGAGVNDSVSAMAFDNNGNLYVGGEFTTAGGMAANRIAKWNGSAWSALDGGFNSTGGGITSLIVDSSGNLYVGGGFSASGGLDNIAKWNGTAWSALEGGSESVVYAMALDSQGNLYAGGDFQNSSLHIRGLGKWNGQAWVHVGEPNGIDGVIHAIVVDGNGTLYAGGNFQRIGGVDVGGVAKWNGSSWSPLPTFSGNLPSFPTHGGVYTLAMDKEENLYVGGDFGILTNDGFVSNFAIWNPNYYYFVDDFWTGLDVRSSVTTASVNALAVDQSGNVYFGGSFTEVYVYYDEFPIAANGIAKLNVNSWELETFGAGVQGGYRGVSALALDVNGNLYVGGDFNSAGGLPVKYIANWNGSAWSGLGGGVDQPVLALAFDNASNLYAGGEFTTAGGFTARRIARWNGGVWSALGEGMDEPVSALVVDSNGSLYAGGNFNFAGQNLVNRLAKWNGSTWTGLGSGVNGGEILCLALDGDSKLYVGGGFSRVGNKVATCIAQADLIGSGVTPIQAWRKTHFGTYIGSGNAANDTDFDKDGILNLLEYSFGLNPTTPDASPVQSTAGVIGMFLNWQQASGLGDVQVRPEMRTSLNSGNWSDSYYIDYEYGSILLSLDRKVVADNGVTKQMSSYIPLESSSKVFGRLKVSEITP